MRIDEKNISSAVNEKINRHKNTVVTCVYVSGTILKIHSPFIGSLQPSLSKSPCVKQLPGKGSLCELFERANRLVSASWNNTKGSIFRTYVYRNFI